MVRKENRASVLVLLSLVATMNVSQAMVLCVGCDGHVAIEPAGHDHCADGTHICEFDAAQHRTGLAPDTGGERCRGCTDISMADEIGSDPSASAASKSLSAGMLAVSSPLLTPPNDAATRANFESRISNFEFLQSLLLSSIVLQV